MTTFQAFDNSTLPVVDVVRNTNEQLGGVPGFVIMASIFLVTFLALKGRGHSSKASMTATSVLLAVVAIVLYPLGMIDPRLFWASLILPGIMTFLMFILD